MKVTFLGTTTLLFDDGVDQVLFDAHVTRPSLLKAFLGKLETDTALVDRVIADFGIDRLKAIFVSHSHYDHVLDAASFAQRCGADVYGSSSTLNVMRGAGLSEERLHSFSLTCARCDKLEGCDRVDKDTLERIPGAHKGQRPSKTDGVLRWFENTAGRMFRVGEFEVTVIPSVHSKAAWYNDDLGQRIKQPLVQPAPKRVFKEGGSYDFLVKHGDVTFLIRPSFNYLSGQLDGIKTDVLLLGSTGYCKETAAFKEEFLKETVEKVAPRMVIPLHWDNFFVPLDAPARGLYWFMDDVDKSMEELQEACEKRGATFVVLQPKETMEV